jgi:hypothetical protein
MTKHGIGLNNGKSGNGKRTRILQQVGLRSSVPLMTLSPTLMHERTWKNWPIQEAVQEIATINQKEGETAVRVSSRGHSTPFTARQKD